MKYMIEQGARAYLYYEAPCDDADAVDFAKQHFDNRVDKTEKRVMYRPDELVSCENGWFVFNLPDNERGYKFLLVENDFVERIYI